MIILVISDIHANLVALEAVLADAGQVDEVWSVGDIVGYGPKPRECLDRVRSLHPAVSVVGNHDHAAIGRIPLADFNPVARAASQWTATQLDLEHVQYLENLPLKQSSGDVTIVHGSPRFPIWEYVYNARIAAKNFSSFDTKLCFLGHTHVPLEITENEALGDREARHPSASTALTFDATRYIINPGSVGQPRDGDPRAAYAMYEPSASRITFRRVSYDVAATQVQMREVGLPDALVRRLARGM